MKILIAEDEAIIAESLYQVLMSLGYEPIEPAGTSDEAIALITETTPDLAIVDIHIGAPFNGFDVAALLQQKNIPFIFLTALHDKETVKRAQAYSPKGYLVKPFNSENLFAAIELAISQHIATPAAIAPAQIFIKNGARHISLSLTDISYLESAGKYVTLHLINGKKYLVRATLGEVLNQLSVKSIMQVHKSFAVNLAYVQSMRYDQLLVNNQPIPVGRTYRDELRQKLVRI